MVSFLRETSRLLFTGAAASYLRDKTKACLIPLAPFPAMLAAAPAHLTKNIV